MLILRDYSRHSARYPLLLGSVVVSIALLQATQITAPIYLSRFVDLIASASPTAATIDRLQHLLAIFAAIAIAGWLIRRMSHYAIARLEAYVMADIEAACFSHLLRHSYRFFISNFAGSLVRKVTRYKRSYEQVADAIFSTFFSTAIMAASILFVLWQRSPLIALLLAGWMLIIFSIQVVLTHLIHPLRLKASAEDSAVTGALADTVGNHVSIDLFSGLAHEERSFRRRLDTLRHATLRAWNTDDIIWAILGMLMVLIEILVFYAGMRLWAAGTLSVGDFVLIQAYLLQLFERIVYVNREVRTVFTALADAAEMREILDTEHEIRDTPDARPLAVSDARVSFENVTFGFNATRPVLRNFSLVIRGGEKVALVGPSGGGKTTITKLLLRLYDVSDGRIMIDGEDVRHATLESLRGAIAYVPQEPTLFHRSLLDNIRYGKRDATDDEVKEAARKAHCEEFIGRLPHGYDTFVGERGVKLSGGERQRIAIARAILRDAPILILDEATSSLDSESEAFIQDALARFMEGRTVIVVAHRLSTIQKMDRIIVIKEGGIVAEGPHGPLLAEDGLYRKLWSIQAGGFLPDSEQDVDGA